MLNQFEKSLIDCGYTKKEIKSLDTDTRAKLIRQYLNNCQAKEKEKFG